VKTSLDVMTLKGLTPAPSQVWGGVRIVPLIRDQVAEDLRIGKRAYQNPIGITRLGGKPGGRGAAYISYIPHGLVVSFSRDGEAAAAFGTALEEKDGEDIGHLVKVLHRMVKREGKNRFRMLPLHIAMEGFLARHFGGPDIAWEEYSKVALAEGLSPRMEKTVHGTFIPGLADALKLFEIHEGQCGALVFVADALASAFVVGHPDDYRALHASLIEDFYGELLLHYGRLGYDAPENRVVLKDDGVETAETLRRSLAEARASWASFEVGMAAGLLGRAVDAQPVRHAGPFTLKRFLTGLEPAEEHHIGEAIVRNSTDELMYLKSYRLSAKQARRGQMLKTLAAHEWDLTRAAASEGRSKASFILNLERAELGFLLQPTVIQKARKEIYKSGAASD